MWRWILILAFYCLPVQAQDTADFSTAGDFIFNVDSYKKGVYKTFHEFQLNTPSESGELVVKKRTAAAQAYLLASRNELYIVDSMGREKKVKDFWGFSDGRDIYIRDNGLNRLQEIGYYCLYQLKGVSVAPLNNPNPNAATYRLPQAAPEQKKKVLNILTGQIYDLTVYNLKKYILAPDKEVLSAFNADRQKKDRMEYYIHWFNERNMPVR